MDRIDEIARLLRVSRGQAEQFVGEVRRLAGRARLRAIQNLLEQDARLTPDQIADRLMDGSRAAPRAAAVAPRWRWDPDTGSIESLDD